MKEKVKAMGKLLQKEKWKAFNHVTKLLIEKSAVEKSIAKLRKSLRRLRRSSTMLLG